MFIPPIVIENLCTKTIQFMVKSRIEKNLIIYSDVTVLNQFREIYI